MAKYIQNKTVLFNRRKYEICWITPYVIHINKKSKDQYLRHLSFDELERFAPEALFIPYNKAYLGLVRIDGILFQIIAFFEKVKNHHRCIIKTGYQTTDRKIIETAQQASI